MRPDTVYDVTRGSMAACHCSALVPHLVFQRRRRWGSIVASALVQWLFLWFGGLGSLASRRLRTLPAGMVCPSSPPAPVLPPARVEVRRARLRQRGLPFHLFVCAIVHVDGRWRGLAEFKAPLIDYKGIRDNVEEHALNAKHRCVRLCAYVMRGPSVPPNVCIHEVENVVGEQERPS